MGENNRYNIIFTSLAQEDLQAIKKYICCDNFKAAQDIVKHILNCAEQLTNNPSMGRAGRVLRTRELIIPKYPYILPYQVRDNNIYILRVLHTSRKWG